MSNLDFREKEWGSADGRRIKIKNLETSHLVNILNWVTDHSKKYSSSIIEGMKAEAEYRKTFLFTEGKPYPQLVNDRWVLLDPTTGKGVGVSLLFGLTYGNTS